MNTFLDLMPRLRVTGEASAGDVRSGAERTAQRVKFRVVGGRGECAGELNDEQKETQIG
jgi:hypothetical protein